MVDREAHDNKLRKGMSCGKDVVLDACNRSSTDRVSNYVVADNGGSHNNKSYLDVGYSHKNGGLNDNANSH